MAGTTDGAKHRMPEITEAVRRAYIHFREDDAARARKLLDEEDHYGLFVHLETIISARRIHDALRKDRDFRLLMASVYAKRHPYLETEDLGATMVEDNLEILHLIRRREVQEMKDHASSSKTVHRTNELAAQLGTFSSGQPARAIGGSNGAYLMPPIPATTSIPLAPSQGGVAPRQPYTTGWTYRPAPANVQLAFDPKRSSKSFFEYNVPPAGLNAPPQPGIFIEDRDSGNQAESVNEAGLDKEPFSALMLRVVSRRSKRVRWSERESGGAEEDGPTQKDRSLLPAPPQTLAEAHERLRAFIASEGVDPELVNLQDVAAWWNSSGKHRHVGSLAMTAQIKANLGPESLLGWLESWLAGDGTSLRRLKAFAEAMGVDWSDIERESGSQTGSPTLRGEPQALDPEPEPVSGESTAYIEPPAPGIHSEGWLRRWLETNGVASGSDLGMTEYRGWLINSPLVQLIRIKNFLADEDLDRTLGWKEHFAEIAIYLCHLKDIWNGSQIWGYDLDEAIRMLRTHWAYEQHHYGKKPLNLNFEPIVFPRRLKALPNASQIVLSTAAQDEPVKPRYLQHRVPESIHDVDYQVPGTLLRIHFLSWYRRDESLVWYNGPEEDVGSGERGEVFRQYGYIPDFNMTTIADERYLKCIDVGPHETARALREECNFAITNQHFMCPGDETIWPDGHAVRQFAEFRGARRAALQQCLQHFDNSENVALSGPFRRLVLPTPLRKRERIRAEAAKKIVYKPIAIKKPPSGGKLDPFGYLYWHRQLDKHHAQRAEITRLDVEDGHWGRMKDMGATDENIVSLDRVGFNAPHRSSFLPVPAEKAAKRLKQLKSAKSLLDRAQRRAPREMLEDFIAWFDVGNGPAERAFERENADIWREIDRQHEEMRKKYGSGTEHKKVTDQDLHWLRFISGPSTNEGQLENEVEPTPRMGIFMQKIRKLLDEPWKNGILADAQDEKTIEEVREKLNNMGTHGGSKQDMVYFLPEEVEVYSQLLDQAGLLSCSHRDGAVFISRPVCTYHPELRINWYASDRLNAAGKRVMDDRDPDELPPTSAVPLDWVTALEAHKQDASNLRGSPEPGLADRTQFALKLIGWRLGFETKVLEAQVQKAYDAIAAQGAGETFTEHVDYHLIQMRDMQGIWDQYVNGHYPTQPVSVTAVVKAADPEAWSKDLRFFAALELVRQGKIRELSEGQNMVWPVRQRWHINEETGEAYSTTHRERIWDWARTGPHGKPKSKKQWFNVDKWPMHLQSAERQREIKETPFQSAAGDVETFVDEKSGDRGDKEVEAERGAVQRALAREERRLEEELKDLQAEQSFVTESPSARRRLTEKIKSKKQEIGELAEVRHQFEADEQLQGEGALRGQESRVRLHEVVLPKSTFLPGKMTFWLGDTPMQQRAIRDARMRMAREAIGDPSLQPGARKLTSFWSRLGFTSQPEAGPATSSRERGGSPEITLPQVSPSEIPRSRPRVYTESESESQLESE